MHTEIPSIGDIKLFISKLDIGVVEEFISKLESITTSSKATSAGSKSYVDKMLVAMSAVDAKMGGLEKQEMASKSESVSVSKDEEMASKSESVSVSKDEEMASKSESASVSKDETAVNAKMVGPEKLEMASKSESASLSKDELEASIKNGDPQGFQFFNEAAIHISSVTKKRDHLDRNQGTTSKKGRESENKNLPFGEDQSRNEIDGWGVPMRPLQDRDLKGR